MFEKVLLVYPGLGKTYAAERNENVLEIQLSMFKNINKRKYGSHFPEHLKGSIEVPLKTDPSFPKNVLECIKNGFSKGQIVVMALKSDNIEFLIEHNIDFQFVMPSGEKINQLQEQYEKRGNTKDYIQRNIESLLANNIIQDNIKYGQTINIDIENNKFIIN